MATPEPEIRAEQGQSTQLPHGQATQLNEALAAVPEQPSAVVPGEAVEPEVEEAFTPGLAPEVGIEEEAVYQPQGELEQFLAGPTEFPDEDMPNLLEVAPLPRGLDEWLPLLGQVAADPAGPPAAKALFAHIQEQLRRRGV